jgi:hypothetical protein
MENARNMHHEALASFSRIIMFLLSHHRTPDDDRHLAQAQGSKRKTILFVAMVALFLSFLFMVFMFFCWCRSAKEGEDDLVSIGDNFYQNSVHTEGESSVGENDSTMEDDEDVSHPAEDEVVCDEENQSQHSSSSRQIPS